MRLFIPAALALLAVPVQAQFWSEIANPKVEVTLVHPPGLGLKVERLAFAPSRDLNSRELADALTADLVQSRQVEVVDRGHLDAILKEQELGANGYVVKGMAFDAYEVALQALKRYWLDINEAPPACMGRVER